MLKIDDPQFFMIVQDVTEQVNSDFCMYMYIQNN